MAEPDVFADEVGSTVVDDSDVTHQAEDEDDEDHVGDDVVFD